MIELEKRQDINEILNDWNLTNSQEERFRDKEMNQLLELY
jgi:hypothetical protein